MYHHASTYADSHLLSPVYFSAAAPTTTTHGFFDCSSFLSPPPPPPSSSSPPYSSSVPSCYLHRSSSSHSLPHPPPFLSPPQQEHHHHHHPPPPPSSSSSSSCDFVDFNIAPMRRVFSTGDLQGTNGVQAFGENCNQGGGAIVGRVGRYSPQERKERIEKYRSKRNQRNFHKKITYACRKTLADSRPRVRGRFARNGEMEMEGEIEAEIAENYGNCNYYNHNQNGAGDYGCYEWRQMQTAASGNEDDDLWTSVLDVFSMDFL